MENAQKTAEDFGKKLGDAIQKDAKPIPCTCGGFFMTTGVKIKGKVNLAGMDTTGDLAGSADIDIAYVCNNCGKEVPTRAKKSTTKSKRTSKE